MQLSFEQIKSVTCGAVDFAQEQDGIVFRRFTPEQFAMYEKRDPFLFIKSQTSAGIRLCFKTDSRSLYLKTTVQNARSRSYFAFEVFADDTPVGRLDNYSDQEITEDYSTAVFPCGTFEKTFDLGEGVKTVTVHLPWNKITKLHQLALDDGAFIEPVKRSKKLLAFGDSITYGFDSLLPSRRYISRLSDAIGAEEFNKGIGGERFCPDLAALPDDFTPDYIVVAYGTNDWAVSKKEVFYADSKAFFAQLDKNYPSVRVFAITPVWRANFNRDSDFDSFFQIAEGIREAVAPYNNVTIINGYDLVPHSADNFVADGLHPNMQGFDHYFTNLWKKIEAIL